MVSIGARVSQEDHTVSALVLEVYEHSKEIGSFDQLFDERSWLFPTRRAVQKGQ